jgi:hypothetical protein
MLTKEEVQSIVSNNIETVYDRIMDKLPQIIASTISQTRHQTAPETHDRLLNLEKKAEQNKGEHQAIMDKLDVVLLNHKENATILREIKDAKITKNWIRSFFKNWWSTIVVISVIIWNIFTFYLDNRNE